MNEDKPQWFERHEHDDRENFGAAQKRDEEIAKTLAFIVDKLNPESEYYILKEIETTLRPIAATYTTTSTLGKWVMASLVGCSMIAGIIYSFYEVFRGLHN